MQLSLSAFRNSRRNKMFGRGWIAAAVIFFMAGVLSVSWSVFAGIVPAGVIWTAPVLGIPAVAEGKAPNQPPEPADDENRAINSLMYRNRDRERGLYHAQDCLREGNVAVAFEQLQQILDAEEDLFLWRKSDGVLTSLRSEASRILQNLDNDNYQAYARFVDSDAGTMFIEAKKQRNVKLFETIAQKYFHTRHGFEATNWLAMRWFDLGDFDLAAKAWESLVTHPHHSKHATGFLRKQLQVSKRLARGSSSQSTPLIQVASNTAFRPNGSRLDVIPAVMVGSPSPHARPVAWRMFQGGKNRTRPIAASTPFLNPYWSIALSEQPSSALTQSIKLWEEKQAKALKSLATALFPIVVENRVVCRDFRGIGCIDLNTGQSLWRYACETSLQNEMNRLDKKHGSGGVHSSRSSSYVQLQAGYAGNSVLGLLSTDGERVYAVDRMVLTASSDSESSKTKIAPETCNQLLALPLESDGPAAKPLWIVGGTPSEKEPALEGHFFRGPPLPLDGKLYVITEHNNQINLATLDPETGKLLWKQGLAFADEAFDVDQDRYPLACPIAFGEGVLACPTQTGLLVGVDSQSGTLLWSYCYAEELYQNHKRGWRDRHRKSWGSPGFPAAPKVFGHQLLLLPRQSQEIHCLDVRTGKRLWKVPREDAEYIGAITEDLVFVVGQRYCRGLSLSQGQELWSLRYGKPAGQGIYAEERYLLPLESGRVAAIHLRTGREIGLSGWRTGPCSAHMENKALKELTDRIGLPTQELPEDWRVGNLIPAGDRILACGTNGLIAFPQTGELLNRQVRNRLAIAPDDWAARLLAAELQLNLGELAAAKTNLETVLSPQQSHPLRGHGELLMRELLFRQLETEPNFAQPVLEELASLVSTPEDRARFLMRKAVHQLRNENPIGALETAHALMDLNYEHPLPWPQNPDHTISPCRFSARLMRGIREQLNPEQLAGIDQQIEQEYQLLLQSQRQEPLQKFLTLYGSWPQAESVRNRLAELAMDRGAFQQAEFLWLKNQNSQDLAVIAQAKFQLIALWNQLGLYSEAAQLASELATPKFRGIPLKNGRTVDEFLENIPRGSMLKQALARREYPATPISRVRIREDRWTPTNKDLLDAFGQYRREFSLLPGNSFQLLDKAWVDEEVEQPETRVAVIDRDAGRIQGKVRIPLRNSYPSLSKRAHVGHFFPVGSINRMTGISLLEIENEEPLWKVKLGSTVSHEHILRVGPAGPSFCTFQGQQELVVLDPITGQTLWNRSDIDHSSGLVSDPYAGLFGDDEVLVLFNSNRSSYTVFETATGEELHHGKLDIDTGQIRRIFGRRLFYITNTEHGRRMRIWDFLKNEMIFDQPAGPRIYSALTPDHELVVLIPSEPSKTAKGKELASEEPSRLQILDVVQNRVLLELVVPTQDLENLNYIRAFKHGDRFYVNFQRSVQMPAERLFSYYASDAFPPVENIQGDLLCVDPGTQKVLWNRTLPQRSILQMPHLRLPVLVMISRVRDRWQGGKQGLLVEVLDRETGKTIARKDNNLSDRVVNLAYDKQQGVLDLNGLKTRIRLTFGAAIPNFPKEDEPF